MIIAIGFASIQGEALWAMETAPFVDAMPLLQATLRAKLPTWPAAFRPEEWDVGAMPQTTLGDTVSFESLADFARIDRARGPAKDGIPDTTGVSVCREVSYVAGAIASGVVIFVFSFTPTADHALQARAKLADAALEEVVSHRVAPITEVLSCAKHIGESVRCAASSDYAPGSAAPVDLTAGKFQTMTSSVAALIFEIVSPQGDCRAAAGAEPPELTA
jgi:hypothetical protein